MNGCHFYGHTHLISSVCLGGLQGERGDMLIVFMHVVFSILTNEATSQSLEPVVGSLTPHPCVCITKISAIFLIPWRSEAQNSGRRDFINSHVMEGETPCFYAGMAQPHQRKHSSHPLDMPDPP